MSIIISINGNVKSGKTNFINKIKQEVLDNKLKNIIVLDDQINHLSKTCNSDRYQLMLLLSRFDQIYGIIETNPDAIIICESCLQTDMDFIIDILYNNNKTDLSKKYTLMLYNLYTNLPKQRCIYLYSTPESILLKILKEDNKQNTYIDCSTVNIDYLVNRHLHYERVFTDNINVIIKINLDKYSNTKYNELISHTVRLLQEDNLTRLFYVKYNYMYNEDITNDLNMVNSYLIVIFIIVSIFVTYIIYDNL